MRKLIYFSVILLCMTIFNSCKKESTIDNSNQVMISKINNWLEDQKTGLQPFKAANIDLLKQNLEYSNLRTEQSDEGEQIIIVPISDKFKTEKVNDKSTIPNLVVLLNKSGNIRKGNVVLFKPEVNAAYQRVPDNAFHDIFNTAEVNCNGQFQFLSVAGRREYQLDYKNGNLVSFGLLKTKEDVTTSARIGSICTDWYLVTTNYYSDGSTSETWDYLGTTCSEQCGDGSYMSLCPDGSNSGGGGGNDFDYEFAIGKYTTWPITTNGANMGITVTSTEYIKGKRNSGYPDGGYFTYIHHWDSNCPTCDDFRYWDENVNASNVSYTETQATSYKTGHLNIYGVI